MPGAVRAAPSCVLLSSHRRESAGAAGLPAPRAALDTLARRDWGTERACSAVSISQGHCPPRPGVQRTEKHFSRCFARAGEGESGLCPSVHSSLSLDTRKHLTSVDKGGRGWLLPTSESKTPLPQARSPHLNRVGSTRPQVAAFTCTHLTLRDDAVK